MSSTIKSENWRDEVEFKHLRALETFLLYSGPYHSSTSLNKLLQKASPLGCIQLLSSNDEVIHAGYTPMAHYSLAVCFGRKR